MARPHKPLNSYPSELRILANSATGSPEIFPLTILFPNHTEAMSFRVLFYTYRRTLRSHLQALEDQGTEPPAHLLIEHQGAELISSPRIRPGDAASATLPNLTNCVFALSASQPSTQTGIAALRKALGEPAPEPALYESPEGYTPEPPAPPAVPCRILCIKDSLYEVPVADIAPDHQQLSDTKLALLYANRLASPANPLSTYKATDHE